MPIEPDKDIQIFPQQGYLEVRFLGAFAVPRFNRQVDLAVRACLERGLSLLLLDYTPLTPVPTTVERFEISTHGAKACAALTKVAGFATPAQRGDKFGAMVARNRGLNVDVFIDKAEAIQWLLATD
jgi:hypothetical protein